MIDVTKIIKLSDEDGDIFHHTVEDYHIDVGGDGFTISYYERNNKNDPFKRIIHMCFSKDQGIAIANAILELSK